MLCKNHASARSFDRNNAVLARRESCRGGAILGSEDTLTSRYCFTVSLDDLEIGNHPCTDWDALLEIGNRSYTDPES